MLADLAQTSFSLWSNDFYTVGRKMEQLGDSKLFTLISNGASNVTLQKYFSHPSLVICHFPTPPIKLKLRLQTGGRIVIANHLDQSL
jgi:hypothetical protein